MILLKCCPQYVSTLGKLSCGHGTGEGQLLFQPQRRPVLKNVQTTAQFHSFQTAYCRSAYLTYMQGTSCEMNVPGSITSWNQDFREKSITSDMQMTPLSWQKAKRNQKKQRGTKQPIDKLGERGQ